MSVCSERDAPGYYKGEILYVREPVPGLLCYVRRDTHTDVDNRESTNLYVYVVIYNRYGTRVH